MINDKAILVGVDGSHASYKAALLGAILSTTVQARYAYARRAVWYARFMRIPLA